MAEALRIAVSGAFGFIGTKLVAALEHEGLEVWPLVRKQTNSKRSIFYDYQKKIIDADKLTECHAVIHLAGKNLMSGLWTPACKKEIYDSRIKSTRFLAHTLAELKGGPKILLNASAIGIYGDRADQKLDEDSLPGQGFLADLCTDWERSTLFAKKAGIRVVNMRISPVLDKDGGLLKKLLPLFSLGLGANIGDGHNYFSHVTRDELIKQILFLLKQPAVHGPVNMVSFTPSTYGDFTHALGLALGKPVWVRIPQFMLKLAPEQMKAACASARVFPKRLLDTGFPFNQADIVETVKILCAHK